ncbi:glycosyltransferase [Neobacillus sp. NPDC058068]|uniref:glycosyltransferase n=1 Tax=Neobacillus sp. NPDC058068 TaxID=3346325 RepID=UPI0036D9F9F8
MKKRVCMFVWNHFTNDARVLRECTALSETDQLVDLICIDNPNNKELPRYEEINPNFKVYRVKRYPDILLQLQRIFRMAPIFKIIGLLVSAYLTVMFPVVVIPLAVLLLLLLKTRMRVIWIRGTIFLRMIFMGLRKNYDIYHSNDLNTLLQGFICSKVRLKKRILIYDSHEVQTSRTGYNSRLYGIIERILIKRIDAMIVENHTRAKYNEDLYGFYPYVVYNYPDIHREDISEQLSLTQQLGLAEDEKILLYQGGIQTGRGLEKLIQAAQLFKEGTLVFIGDGKIKADLERMVDQMDLHHKVKFIPKVPLTELPKYTRNAYLGFQVLNNVCFNHYSASSNKLFEYIMSDVPVIACSFPEIKKVVEGDALGLCIDSHDSVSIAEGVNYLLDSQAEYQKMKDRCAAAKEKYNWTKEKVNFLNVYSSTKKYLA